MSANRGFEQPEGAPAWDVGFERMIRADRRAHLT